MDSSAPAAVPWVVLGVALLALAGVAAWLLTGRRGRPGAGSPVRREPPVPRPATRFPHDDLPGFLDAPPGTPPVPAAVAPPADPAPEAEDPDGGSGSGRVVAGMAAVALLLVGALAVVAAGTRDDDDPPVAAEPSPPPPAASPTAGTPTPVPVPELPGVPADPLPGESGAGALADRSVPLGEDGVTATLAFEGIVVARHAVGITVAEPVVSVTATGDPAGDGAALAHLALPTWNCVADEPPPDPEEAGCVRSTPEYADLPSPALQVTRDGDDVRLTGRFPTYTRPIATAPAYTGRVYDLTVTVSPAGPVRDGGAVAEATLFLGTDRTTTAREGFNVVRYAG
ncbi:hypothetical protein [Geodermatophilus sp. SYSU D00079]